ncbi:MAG: SDR family oxidoreductase [Candidatus Ratteibacteria bacterium]|jgi:3-oxoacyl-[acyl-carrier protein] reductase
MDLRIKDKRALVVGGGRGLGRCISLRLAEEGTNVAVLSRTEDEVASVVNEMGGVLRGHYSFSADLMLETSPERVFKKLTGEFGPPDIVVHNVGGTLGIRDPFSGIEDWRKVARLNLEIAIELNRLIIPGMQQRKWGRVVHVSSAAAVRGIASLPYVTAKAALNAYVRGMGCAVASDGVIVTAVMPGAILTEGGDWDTRLEENPESVKRFLEEKIAIKRFAKPEEISDIVVFLCSESASFCAGAIIPVDGGIL